MKYRKSIALAGASLLVVAANAPTAYAQDKAPDAPQAASANQDDGVIIVNARRKEEALQDVPSTVTAVTGKQLEEFHITQFQDISSLVAGLTLQSDDSGHGATAQVRGVIFQVNSQGQPTVEQYLNEAPLQADHMFASNFDIGQIEVLRGPQGTLRGQSAPSGAITETTHRPDLNEAGGYVSYDITTLNAMNLQGAIGVPIIKDVLAIRVAGVYDDTDAGGVRSVDNHSGGASNPYVKTFAERVTARFDPASNFSSVVMYQHLVRNLRDFGPLLYGTGALGLTAFPGNLQPATGATCNGGGPTTFGGLTNCGNPAVFAPPNFNGPALTAQQLRAVEDFPDTTRQEGDLVTGQADWHVAGQKLSFVGSYQHFRVNTNTDQDASNTIVGTARFNSAATDATENRQSYELRLSSETPLFGGLLDYTVGGFYLKTYGLSQSEQRNTLLMQGAFGSPLGAGMLPGGGFAPGTLSPFTYDKRYVVGFNISTPRDDLEKSIFGTLTFHLGDKTEFTAGGRQIFASQSKEVDIIGRPGLAAVFNPNGLGPCPATLTGFLPYLTGAGTVNPGTPVVGQTYPGTCDVRVDIGENNGAIPGVGAPTLLIPPTPFGVNRESPFVYNFSLSHKFTPDLMVYASYGTSWRPGPGPITAAPTCASAVTPGVPDPNYCLKYNFLDPESSQAAEIGIKASFFDKRLNIAVAGYRQNYSGLLVWAPGGSVPYLSGNCTAPINSQLCTVSSGAFTFNAPAKTYGIDVDSSFRLNDDFNMGVLFSWSHGRFNNALVPCADSNFDGIPDSGVGPTTAAAWLAAGGPYGPAKCKVNTSSTTAPPWNVTVRAEYSHQIFGDSFGGRGFLRALVNYYPKNTSVQVSNVSFVPAEYALVNLWAGIRGTRGDWEISLSAKNLFNNQTILLQQLAQGTLISPQRGLNFGANNLSGYLSESFVPRREFSLNLRYAFGSR